MMKNLFYFCVGLLISVGLFFVPYANAQMAPYPSVSGPFSPYPPQYNPYLPNPVSGAPSAISQATSAGVNASQSGTATVKTPSGVRIPVPVTQAANVSKAAIAVRALGCTTPITAAVCTATAAAALAELLDQPTGVGRYRRCPNGVAGWVCEANPAAPNWSQTQTSWTSVAPCQNITNACTYPQAKAATVAQFAALNRTLQSEVRTNNQVLLTFTPGGGTGLVRFQNGTVLPNDAALMPSTNQSIQQGLQEKMDADFNANRRLYDAMKRDEANHPSRSPDLNPIQPDTPVSVNAPPVTSPDRTVSETKIPKSDGSTDTKTVTEKTTVSPTTTGTTQGTVKTTYPSTTITTTTITNNVTNNTTTETTTENNVPAEEEKPDEDDVSFTDSQMPELPELYEQKYPDGIAGVWRDNKPDVSSTAFYQGVRSMFPTFGGGQCPSFSIPMNLGIANYGSGGLPIPCWLYQAIGLMMMATATFTARKIIF